MYGSEKVKVICGIESFPSLSALPGHSVKRSAVTRKPFEWLLSENSIISTILHCIRLLGEIIAGQGYCVSHKYVFEAERCPKPG